MAHTFLNIGFETADPVNLVSWFVDGPDGLAVDGYVADDWGGTAVGLAQDAPIFDVTIAGVTLQSNAEHFGADWDSNELALFEYDDPPTQLSEASFDTTIAPEDFEDLEEGWSTNENFLFAAGPQLAAAFEAAVPNAYQPNPKGVLLIGPSPENSIDRILVYDSALSVAAASVDSGISVARLTGNNDVVFQGRATLGTIAAPFTIIDLIAINDAGTERYFALLNNATNSFVREFFPNSLSFGTATQIGVVGSVLRNVTFDGTSLWWTRQDTVGLTTLLERSALPAAGAPPNTPNLSIDLLTATTGALEFDSANGVLLLTVATTLERREIVGGTVTGSVAHTTTANAITFGGGFAWTVSTASTLRKVTVSSMTITDSVSLSTPFGGTIAGVAYEPDNAKLLMIGSDGADTMIAQKWDATASPLSTGAEGGGVSYGAFGDNTILAFIVGTPFRIAVRSSTVTEVMFIIDPEVDDTDGKLFIAFPFSTSGAPTILERFPPTGGGEDVEDFEEVWGNSSPETFSLVLGSVIAALFDVGTPQAFEDFEEEWSSNEGFDFDITTTTQTAASFDGTSPQAFEDFEETDFTEWKVIVNVAQAGDYTVTINSVDHIYVATGGDTLTTIRDGLVVQINAGFQPVTASPEVATNVLQVASDDLPPDFTFGVDGPASNDLERQPTDESLLWTQSGQMRTV